MAGSPATVAGRVGHFILNAPVVLITSDCLSPFVVLLQYVQKSVEFKQDYRFNSSDIRSAQSAIAQNKSDAFS